MGATLPQLKQPPVTKGGGHAVGTPVKQDAVAADGDTARTAASRRRLTARFSLRAWSNN